MLSALENPTPSCYFIFNTSTQELWDGTKYSRMSRGGGKRKDQTAEDENPDSEVNI